MGRNSGLKVGLIFSYALLIVNTLYGLFITPFILGQIGQSAYGVYKSVASLSSSLAVLDLGLGATTTRYMSLYNARNDKVQAGNFWVMILIPFAVLAVVLGGVGAGMRYMVPTIYAHTFSPEQIIQAKQLISVLLLNMVLRLLENLLFGILNGFERFGLSNGVKLLSLVTKIALILLVLPLTKNILYVLLAETGIVITAILFFLYYIIFRLGIRPKLVQWDQAVFKESFGYTALMFIQTITIQFNGNVDNILIGAKVGATSVTVYAMALLVFGMYENLSGSVANLMLPGMTRRVVAGDTPAQLQQSVEKAGRLQFMLLGAALGGFAALGQEFYGLWLGEGFADCYYLTLILMVPVTFPMIQNVCLSVLRAQNKMLYRTVTLGISCVINITVSLIGLHFWGYWGAALGTAAATVSNLIFMNVYYHRVLKFRVFAMFGNIIGKTIIGVVLAFVVTSVLHRFVNGSWIAFAINVAVYCAVYGACLFGFSLTAVERKQVLRKFGGSKL